MKIFNCHGQSDFVLKLSSVAYNLDQDTETSAMIIEPGAIVSYEFFLRDLSFSARFTQAIRVDNDKRLAAYTTAKFHKSLYQRWKSDLNIGGGVGIAYRWLGSDSKENSESKNYTASGNFESGNVFLTGSIEFNYSLTRKTDLSISIDRAYPTKVAINLGFRYWISKKIKKRYKCISCPDWG
jgi:hypothetical protein